MQLTMNAPARYHVPIDRHPPYRVDLAKLGVTSDPASKNGWQCTIRKCCRSRGHTGRCWTLEGALLGKRGGK